jgi:hypothetical protein
MASVLLSPVGNGQQFFDDNGLPLAGGLIYTYQSGSSTPLATYTDSNGNIANANPIVLDAAGRVPNEIWMFAGYTYKFIIKTSADVLIQTLDNLYPILQTSTAVGDTIPAGLIAMWSGSTGSIPSGWLLCDGTNGTPNLRNSFIIGAGDTYAVNATGGSADSIVVAHTHTATSVVTDPGHQHNYSTWGELDQSGPISKDDSCPRTTYQTSSATTGITVATTNASTGVSGTNANLPPYYALAYIMKT